MSESDINIILRAPEPADVDSMYLIENDPRVWSDGNTLAPVSRKQLWDYVANYDGDIYSSLQLRLIIQSVDSGEMLGVIDLYEYDRIARRAYVGIIVKEQYRGRGVARKTLELVINYCRDRLDMRQLAAIVRIDNDSSRRLFVGCGFEITGHFNRWIKSHDSWIDALHLQLDL